MCGLPIYITPYLPNQQLGLDFRGLPSTEIDT